MQEQWASIAGHYGRYEVSTLGRIRRRSFMDKRGVLHAARGLATSCGNGYATAYVGVDGIRAGILVHRAMALAFVPNPNNLPHVNHIDGNKRNNELSNLEWVTQSENTLHAKRIGLWRQKLTEDAVREIRRDFVKAPTNGVKGGNSRELARRFGVTREQVLNVVTRRQWPWLE